jgi:glycosyltransferase involved in cell wall biosynthesis
VSGEIAYVIGGCIDPKKLELVESGHYPRAEYQVFIDTYDADLLTFDEVPQATSAIARMCRSLDKRYLALSALTIERASKYKAIIVSGEDVGLIVALGSLLNRIRVPIFIITHGSYFASKKFKYVAAILRRSSNVNFLTLSDSLKQQLISVFGFSKDQVQNTGYGVDTEFFKPEPLASVPVIVSAGTANRDYHSLVAASEGLGIDVKIAADSAWFPVAVDIENRDLIPHVEVRSYGNYCGLRNLYAQAAFVVVPLHPSKHACGYAVIAEAMAMGKCVVSTLTDSVSDFVVEGETGFCVPPNDVTSLRERIEWLLANPDRCSSMGEAARLRIEREFSLLAYCKRIAAVVMST